MLTPGSLIAGKYKVVGPLESGGMGEVFEAWQVDLSRAVAIKLMHSYVADNPVLLQRFRREAEALGSLGHPNIVQIIEFRNDPGEPPMLVMEKLEGKSLRKLMREGGLLAPPRAAFIALQILSALSAAHRANIVHRDIKPSNVFILKTLAVRDFVKLLDFGVAKVSHPETSSAPLTSMGEVIGTEPYMAPEQAAGQPVDGRSDLFAVGCVLFEVIAGERPRVSGTRPPGSGPLPCRKLRDVVPTADAGLAEVVDRALAHDPADRYPNAEAMAAALAPFASAGDGTATGALPVAPANVAAPSASRERETVASPRPAPLPGTVREGHVEAPAPPPPSLEAAAAAFGTAVMASRPMAGPGLGATGPAVPVAHTAPMSATPRIAATGPVGPTQMSAVSKAPPRAPEHTLPSPVAPSHPPAQPYAPARSGAGYAPMQAQRAWPIAAPRRERTGVSTWWLLVIIVPAVIVLALGIGFVELASAGAHDILEDKKMLESAPRTSCVAPATCTGVVTIMGGANYPVCAPVPKMAYTPGAVIFYSSGATRPGYYKGPAGKQIRVTNNDNEDRDVDPDDLLGLYCRP